jgi:hypothetical protein
MKETDWHASGEPIPMLIFLRGEVTAEQRAAGGRLYSSHGELWSGPGDLIDAEQCRRFTLACLTQLDALPLDERNRRAVATYRRYARGEVSREEAGEAYRKLPPRSLSGAIAEVIYLHPVFWNDTPIGAAEAANSIARVIASVKTQDSVAATCAGATEDELFEWSFFGYLPDPEWQAARAEAERAQAALLRAIVGNPFRRSSKGED